MLAARASTGRTTTGSWPSRATGRTRRQRGPQRRPAPTGRTSSCSPRTSWRSLSGRRPCSGRPRHDRRRDPPAGHGAPAFLPGERLPARGDRPLHLGRRGRGDAPLLRGGGAGSQAPERVRRPRACGPGRGEVLAPRPRRDRGGSSFQRSRTARLSSEGIRLSFERVTGPSSSKPQGEDAGSLTPYDRRRAAFGARLRELRRTTGLNQALLAERLGVTQSMVSKFETARDVPTLEMVDRLADALGLSADVRGELHDRIAELAVEVNAFRVMQRRGQRWVQAQVGEQERAASTISVFQPSLVPGLLQTRDYTRGVLPLLLPASPDPHALIPGPHHR